MTWAMESPMGWINHLFGNGDHDKRPSRHSRLKTLDELARDADSLSGDDIGKSIVRNLITSIINRMMYIEVFLGLMSDGPKKETIGLTIAEKIDYIGTTLGIQDADGNLMPLPEINIPDRIDLLDTRVARLERVIGIVDENGVQNNINGVNIIQSINSMQLKHDSTMRLIAGMAKYSGMSQEAIAGLIAPAPTPRGNA